MITRFKRLRNSRGDTIVEVLISIVVLALVLTAAYALSTHSLSTGVDAQKRNKALAVVNGQISQLVNAQSGLSTGLAKYTTDPGPAFCINQSGDKVVATDPACTQNDFTTTIVYDKVTGTFTVTTTWARTGASNVNKVTLYYKAPSKFVSANQVCLNLPGFHTVVPPGYVIDANGDCVPVIVNPPPIDVCLNLSGFQTVVPSGYRLNNNGNCVIDDSSTSSSGCVGRGCDGSTSSSSSSSSSSGVPGPGSVTGMYCFTKDGYPKYPGPCQGTDANTGINGQACYDPDTGQVYNGGSCKQPEACPIPYDPSKPACDCDPNKGCEDPKPDPGPGPDPDPGPGPGQSCFDMGFEGDYPPCGPPLQGCTPCPPPSGDCLMDPSQCAPVCPTCPVLLPGKTDRYTYIFSQALIS